MRAQDLNPAKARLAAIGAQVNGELFGNEVAGGGVRMTDLEAFGKLVQALDAWRGQMIFIGGWGHRLPTRHPDSQKQAFEPVFTRDTDLAFANRAPREGNIKAALAAHGFNEEFSGTSKPPAAQYTLGNEENGFYAEFLTPLFGSPCKRNGKPVGR